VRKHNKAKAELTTGDIVTGGPFRKPGGLVSKVETQLAPGSLHHVIVQPSRESTAQPGTFAWRHFRRSNKPMAWRTKFVYGLALEGSPNKWSAVVSF
jgi:hypothetical protein